MVFYKRVKFPIEVTRGKANDLYRLRFMRKSELDPGVRHNLRHNVCQMGRQLDLWFKEQSFTIGSLTKAQEKIHQSRKRLKTEIRQSKKREYARKQEEIRIKLKTIKMKMMMMKAVQKFKENVIIARSYRQTQSSLKGNVDVLRVSGNKQLIHGSVETPKTSDEIERIEKAYKRTANSRTDNRTSKYASKDVSSQESSNIHDSADTSYTQDEDAEDDPQELQDEDETLRYTDDAMLGQRYPSAHGPRMETIPEETEELEIDMETYIDLPRLTKKRLSLLNRSQSKKNIFDVNESVPLLPELSGSHAHTQSTMRRHLPDTADKETQTSDKSKSSKRKKGSHLRRKAEENNGKKTIVVKVPWSKIPSEREDSAKSNSGHHGSDDSDGYDNDETTDTDFAFGFESDLITSETEDFLERSDDDNDIDDDETSINHTLPIPEEFSFTLTKYKTTLRRKAENNPSQSFPSVTNLEANFPNITTFSIQNPFSIRYKERSFFMKPPSNERLTGSAKLERTGHAHNTHEDKKIDSPRQTNHAKIAKKHRSEEIKKQLMSDNHKQKEKPNIAIYGRKPDGVAGPQFPSPPSTPFSDHYGHQVVSPRRAPPRTHHNLLYTQKRAKEERQDKIHDIVSSEPIQKYERTRSGNIRPFGTPRIPNHEIPSLREQYYRDKLLKAERDKILKQNIKMKRFIDTFDKGRDSAKLPTVSSSEDSGPETGSKTDSTNRPRKTLGNILFKVYQPEQNVEYERKVIPGVSTTSLRLLRNCRYLREYKPLTEQEKKEIHSERESSWDLAKTRAESSKAFLANVRVRLN